MADSMATQNVSGLLTLHATDVNFETDNESLPDDVIGFQNNDSSLPQNITAKHNVPNLHLTLDAPENRLFLPPSSPAPRSKTPFDDQLADFKKDTITPTKPPDNSDPWTPNTNFKLLMSVASPEIRKMEELRQSGHLPQKQTVQPTYFVSQESSFVSKVDEEFESQCPGSRKEKSLGLLCQRFLAKYPTFPDPAFPLEISLDEVAKDLKVERRRIYDIVNVLESVEMVSRRAKNRYIWHGKTNLAVTLAKLKSIAVAEKLGEQIEKVKDFDLSGEPVKVKGEYRRGKKTSSPRKKLPLQSSDDSNVQKGLVICDGLRKEKSLGIMSQKFLMLFLVSKKTVNLEMAAKVLVGDPSMDKTDSSKFKTKIRRLYDIANILSSLDLIKKVHVTEVRGRKPAFQYVGPEISENSHIQVTCSNDGFHRPSSKHSLLDCIGNPNGCGVSSTSHSTCQGITLTPTAFSVLQQPVIKSEVQNQPKKPFGRHSSFDVICNVAELERNKLYGSQSQPSSPVHKRLTFPEDSDDSKESCQSEPLPAPPANKSSAPAKSKPAAKRVIVIKQSSAGNQSVGNTVTGQSANVQQLNILSVQNTNQQPAVTGASKSQTLAGAQPSPTQVQATLPGSELQTVINVTPDQLIHILKSLGRTSEATHVDAATQASPEYPQTCLPDVTSTESLTSPIPVTPSQQQLTSITSVFECEVLHGNEVTPVVDKECSRPANIHPNKRRNDTTADLPAKRFCPQSEAVTPQSDEPVSGPKYFRSNQLSVPVTLHDVEVASITHPPRKRNKPRPSPLRSLSFGDPVIPVTAANHAAYETITKPFLVEPDFSLASPLIQEKELQTPSTYGSLDLTDPKSSEEHFVFPPCTSSLSEASSNPSTPTLHISNTSSPVMMLPGKLATKKGPLPRVQASSLVRSKSVSPTTLTFGGAGISSLQHVNSNSQPAVTLPLSGQQIGKNTGVYLSNISNSLLMSNQAEAPMQVGEPKPVQLTPVGSDVISPIIGCSITPVAVHQTKNFYPASNAIVNLGQIFSQSENEPFTFKSNITNVAFSGLGPQTANLQTFISPSAGTAMKFRSPSGQFLGVQLQQPVPLLNPTTSPAAGQVTPTDRPMVVPNPEAFFRTPGGLIPMSGLVPQNVGSKGSAFTSVPPKGKAASDIMSAARKLAIQDCVD